MALYALLDSNNVVENIIVVNDSDEGLFNRDNYIKLKSYEIDTKIGSFYDGRNFNDTPYNYEDIIGSMKSEKAKTLRSQCEASIYRGFESDGFFYENSDKDQRNMLGSVLSSFLNQGVDGWTTPFWCLDIENNRWSFRQHTHSQIQSVGLAAKQHVVNQQEKLIRLLDDLNSASTHEQISSILW